MNYEWLEVHFGIFLLIMFVLGMGCCIIAGYMAHAHKDKRKGDSKKDG